MMSRIGLQVVAVASLLLVVSSARADDNWPQWHGPGLNGVGADGDYPVEFSADSGYAWKKELPGSGVSTPAVWGERIFVTCGIEGKDGVVAYDFKGEEVWRKQLGDEAPGHRSNSSGSNPSPVTDGKNLIVYYNSGRIACLDLAGKEIWQKNIQELYGKNTMWWDVGNSPALAGDRVIVSVMQGPLRNKDTSTRGASYVAALDLANGEIAWKTPREYERPAESDNAYTTPLVLTLNGKPTVVQFGADHLTGHDLASGDLLWDLPGFNPKDEGSFRSISSPAISGDWMFLTYGRARNLAGLRLTGEKPEVVWQRNEQGIGADVPTPVAKGDIGYVLTDTGHVECVEIPTGKEIWAGDLPKHRTRYFSSPTYAGGKLYCCREDGVTFVIDVTNGFKLLQTNEMREMIIATPVPVRGGLLIRGAEHLFWINGKAPKESQTAG